MLTQATLYHAELTLSPMTSDDEALFVELYSNPKIMRQIATPFTPEEAAEIFVYAIQERPNKKNHYWVVRDDAGNSAGCGVLIALSPDVFELGFMLLPRFSRRGLALEALRVLIQFAFVQWQASSVVVKHKVTNLAAERTTAHLGLVKSSCDAEYQHWQLSYPRWLASQRTASELTQHPNDTGK